jgi:hypothetical protein
MLRKIFFFGHLTALEHILTLSLSSQKSIILIFLIFLHIFGLLDSFGTLNCIKIKLKN